MKNNEETKEKITHHVHVNGMKSKISERFIDTNVFNKSKMEISDFLVIPEKLWFSMENPSQILWMNTLQTCLIKNVKVASK